MLYTYKQCIADAIEKLRVGDAGFVCEAILVVCNDDAYAEEFTAQFHQDCQVSRRGCTAAWLSAGDLAADKAFRIEVLVLIHTEQYALLHEKLREHFANNPSPYYLGGNNYDE